MKKQKEKKFSLKKCFLIFIFGVVSVFSFIMMICKFMKVKYFTMDKND